MFGVPDNHPSRLERHINVATTFPAGGGSKPWVVSLIGTSHLGVPRYRLTNRNQSHGLEATGNQGSVTMAGGSGHSWLLVPHLPHGYNIVHAGSGRRLEISANGTNLELSTALTGFTHWDVLCPDANLANHRPHFWLPPFFAQCLCDHRRAYPVGHNMEAVVGSRLSGVTTNLERKRCANQDDFLKACDDRNSSVASLDGAGMGVFYTGSAALAADGSAGPGEADMALVALTGQGVMDSAEISVERRVYGDARARGVTADANNDTTAEYTEAWVHKTGLSDATQVFYRRRAVAVDPVAVYRACVRQLGLDDETCRDLLPAGDNERYPITLPVLGHLSGQGVPGVCGIVAEEPTLIDTAHQILAGGARIRSDTCQRFCGSDKARDDGAVPGPHRRDARALRARAAPRARCARILAGHVRRAGSGCRGARCGRGIRARDRLRP